MSTRKTNRMTGGITIILMIVSLAGLILAAGCAQERTWQSDIAVYKMDSNGSVEWVSTLDSGMPDNAKAIIDTSDGGFLIAGSTSNNPAGYVHRKFFPRLVKLDKSGSIIWDLILNSTSRETDYGGAGEATIVRETSDGHFVAGTYWGFILTIRPDGTMENVRQLKSGRIFVLSFDREGNVIEGTILSAAEPLAYSTDRVSLYVENSFADGKNVNWDPSREGIIHIAKQKGDGSMVWDHSLTSPGHNYPVSVIPARDGGYVALVVT
jgi:hypothetical protein